MDWEGKNVLVTGAGGFVGSWLSESLIEKQANVVALLKDDAPDILLRYSGIYSKLKAVIKGDIIDSSIIKKVFADYDIDTCFHLAAQAIVGIANSSPIPTFETNIMGTWNILETARVAESVERVVVASSDKCYGEPIKLPITEDHPLIASYPYDASKACADILSRTYAKTYGLPIGVTRCCNIYGGGDINFSRIVPDSVHSVLLNKNPIIRSDGTPVRDFIFIADAVSAYLILAENLEKNGIKGEAFNFGSNSPITILNLVNKIIRISEKNLKPEIIGKNKPEAEIDAQYLSSEKAEKLLNWRPKVSLENGLKETIRWYSDFFTSPYGKEFF
jgi:CDP-glucose 4,6-dehydratase